MGDTNASNLVVVFSSQGPLAAEVVKAKLIANGVPAILRYQSVSRVFAVTVDGLGLVEVLVTLADQTRALEILEPSEESSSTET